MNVPLQILDGVHVTPEALIYLAISYYRSNPQLEKVGEGAFHEVYLEKSVADFISAYLKGTGFSIKIVKGKMLFVEDK